MSAYYAGPNPPDAPELRVLGALIEKRRTTPDGYPLSVNSLRLACNQATNRDPVVEYDEHTVLDAARLALSARVAVDETTDTTPEQVIAELWERTRKGA